LYLRCAELNVYHSVLKSQPVELQRSSRALLEVSLEDCKAKAYTDPLIYCLVQQQCYAMELEPTRSSEVHVLVLFTNLLGLCTVEGPDTEFNVRKQLLTNYFRDANVRECTLTEGTFCSTLILVSNTELSKV
jgi:hypothetical protein